LVASLPLIRNFRQKRYWCRFSRSRGWEGLHYGLFDSFPDAVHAAPSGADGTFELDHEWYVQSHERMECLDYPLLYWLRPLIRPGIKIFDYGGHIGLAYYNYHRFIAYPDDMRWVVGEIPKVVTLGREIQTRRAAPHLEFETGFAAADGASILISSGCIQYVETPLSAQLRALRNHPRHLLLNKVPLYDKETRVTLQNTGTSFSPYWLFNRLEFIDDLTCLGYELVDEWPCPERSVQIGLPPAYRIRSMSGLYFRVP
jgi:putative methyltransferase (TIGR04325 family)